MQTKRNIALAALGAVVGTVVILTQAAWSGLQNQPLKLEGSWVAMDQIGEWMYSFSPSDPGGREAAFQGTIHVVDPTLGGLIPDAQYVTGFIGHAVVTGPEEAVFTTLQYVMKQAGPVPEKVAIIIGSGTAKQIAPNRVEANHRLALYLPSQDADGDGLPDMGQEPLICVPHTSMDTRLPLLRPCTPTPAP